jgi:hypothetical protein
MEPRILIHHEGQAAGLYCDVPTWEAVGTWLITQDLPHLARFHAHRFSTDLPELAAELLTVTPPAELAPHFTVLAAFVQPDGPTLIADILR